MRIDKGSVMLSVALVANSSAWASGSVPPADQGQTELAFLAPRMSVPNPSYTNGSGQFALFSGINTLRQKLGVGLLAQDAALDTAAQAHAVYLSAHSVAQHDQSADALHFYETTPLLRARKAGVGDSQWVAEVVGAARGPDDSEIGAGCIDQWYHTVYHLQSLVTNQESMGIGFSGTGALGLNHCVVEFGTNTATQPGPTPNGVPYGGGQQISAEIFVTVPADRDTDVRPGFNFAGESPNPAPDLLTPGRPLMVYANGALAEVLSVTTFKLVASGGAEVAARILVSPAAKGDGSNGVADEYLRNNAAFLVPLAPLADRETYTASFSGTRAGKPVSISWPFRTATQATSAFR